MCAGVVSPNLNGLEAGAAPNEVEPVAAACGRAGEADFTSVPSVFGALVDPKLNIGAVGASAGLAGAPKENGDAAGDGAAAVCSVVGLAGAPKVKGEVPEGTTGAGATIGVGVEDSFASAAAFAVAAGAPKVKVVAGAGVVVPDFEAAPNIESGGVDAVDGGVMTIFAAVCGAGEPKSDAGAEEVLCLTSAVLPNVNGSGLLVAF